MFGALPSRIARCSTGSARPSISRKTIPGASVSTRSPERRAIRWITRSVYVSSSFVPKITSSTTPTADATSATRSADQNESIERSPSVIQSAASSISASRTRTSRSPVTSISGRRSAAIERRQDRVEDRDHRRSEERPTEVLDVARPGRSTRQPAATP